MRRVWILLPLVCLLLVAPAEAEDAQPGAGGIGNGGSSVASAEPDVLEIVLTEVEKRLIRDYYGTRYAEYVTGTGKGKGKVSGLPPGLAKRGTLPPGLQQQLVRNGTLPPGLEKRALPADLLVQLRPRPPGYEFVLVDDKVLLVQAATNLILDLLTVAAIDAD